MDWQDASYAPRGGASMSDFFRSASSPTSAVTAASPQRAQQRTGEVKTTLSQPTRADMARPSDKSQVARPQPPPVPSGARWANMRKEEDDGDNGFMEVKKPARGTTRGS